MFIVNYLDTNPIGNFSLFAAAYTKYLLSLMLTNVERNHCVKSVRIRSYSGSHFPAFGLNNSEYGHFLRSELKKLAATVKYYGLFS